jgi:hypothetical protein
LNSRFIYEHYLPGWRLDCVPIFSTAWLRLFISDANVCAASLTSCCACAKLLVGAVAAGVAGVPGTASPGAAGVGVVAAGAAGPGVGGTGGVAARQPNGIAYSEKSITIILFIVLFFQFLNCRSLC